MRTGTTLRVGTAVLAGLLSAGLAGCSGSGPKPGTLTPTPTASSTTASPSPSATTPEQQIEAAVRAYYAALLLGVQTGQASDLKKLVTKTCPCFAAVETIEENQANGRSGPEARLTIQKLTLHNVEAGLAGASVVYDVNGYDLVDKSGDVVSTIKPRHDAVDLTLVRHPSGNWVVSNVTDLSPS